MAISEAFDRLDELVVQFGSVADVKALVAIKRVLNALPRWFKRALRIGVVGGIMSDAVSETTRRKRWGRQPSPNTTRPEIKVWPTLKEIEILDALYAQRGIQRKPYVQALLTPALALEDFGVDAIAVLTERLRACRATLITTPCEASESIKEAPHE
jgi:hypothetical protein